MIDARRPSETPSCSRLTTALHECSRALVLLALTLPLTGCIGGGYKAATLPATFVAKPSVSATELNLAGLSKADQDSSSLQPGDLVNVKIQTGLEEESPAWPCRIDGQGTTEVPLVGRVRLAGLREDQAGTVIRQASMDRGIYRNPNVTLSLEARKVNQVSVMGAVAKPGVIELPVKQSDLITALSTVGGLKDDAQTTVVIKLPGGEERSIDLQQASQYSREQLDLPQGSVVQVPNRPEESVFVQGLVNKPNRFVIEPGQQVHLLDAIAMAGSREFEVADGVTIVRQVPGQDEPILIKASVRKAKVDKAENLMLADGDVVTVEETPLTFLLRTARGLVGFTGRLPGL